MVEKLQALEAGPKTVNLSYVNDLGTAVEQARDGTYKAVVVIPPDFTKDINEGRLAELGVFTDNVDSVSSDTLESVLDGAAATLRDDYVTAREPKLNQIVLRPAELFTTVDYDRSLIPGVIVMSLFMGSLMSGVFNWVMDRFMGVTECYLVTPLSRWEIAGGILASGVTITSVAAIIVLFVGLLVTGATIQGGFPALLTIIGIIVVGATGLLAMTFSVLGRATHPRLVGTFAGFLNVILFFPERRHLSDRELSEMAAQLRALQSRDACGECAEIDPLQGRGVRRGARRFDLPAGVHRNHAGTGEHVV